MKILSCIPEQTYGLKQKLEWINDTAADYKPDLFVLPQEYFGGIQNLLFKQPKDEPLIYNELVVINEIGLIAKKFDMAIAVGALVQDQKLKQNRERVYIIDPIKGVTGAFDKMMLPAYDHINAKGLMRVSPEPDFTNRCRVAAAKQAFVSVLFCWEVYSNFIWHQLAIAQPDLLLSMIKFGVAGFPQKNKDEKGNSIVTGFGFGDDGGWIERLQMGAKFDVACPIVCSTNSWNQPNRARPLAGTINPFGESSLWYPPKGSRGDIEQRIVVDELDPLEFRYNRGNKHIMFEKTGKWQSSEVRKQTMAWKIRRMERKFAGMDNKARENNQNQTELL